MEKHIPNNETIGSYLYIVHLRKFLRNPLKFVLKRVIITDLIANSSMMKAKMNQ